MDKVSGASADAERGSREPSPQAVLAVPASIPSRVPWINPYHWPCRACGAMEPTPEGHDPCIASLPGVEFACCGHGRGPGYVAFSNGTVIRGEFEQFYGWPNPVDSVADRNRSDI